MLTERDQQRLRGVHSDLIRVVVRASEITPSKFWIVGEGLRTIDRQRQLLAQGASKTIRSRHLTGHAVDLYPLNGKQIETEQHPYFFLAGIVFAAAKLEGVPLEWGGHWKSFFDGAHFQLPRATYPGE